MKSICLFLSLVTIATSVQAQPVDHDDDDDDDDDEERAPDTEITVTARRLDAARSRIEPELGATTYTLSNETIEHRPGGETGDIGSILLQLPGVQRDGTGSLRVRQSPGGVQYRLNNVILPEGAVEFGEMLSSRLADQTRLITGALPAQYGLSNGGVVNVITKNGHYMEGGQVELYGGSHNILQPAIEWAGSHGNSSLFLSGSLHRTDNGLPSIDGTAHPLHDEARELEGFGYFDQLFSEGARLSLIIGSSNERKQIPGSRVAQVPDSENRHGVERSRNHYAIATYQLSKGPITLQASLSALSSRESVRPREPLSLAVDGVSRSAAERRLSVGTQVEGAFEAGRGHTVRAGVVASRDNERTAERSLTLVAALDDTDTEHRTSISAFLQDEWKLDDQLTLNAGLRLDQVSGLGTPVQLGPRLSLVWAPPGGTSAHLGYSRYFVAPPLGGIASRAALLAQPATDDPVRGETDDYFDAGVQQRLGDLTIGLDAYWRSARHLVAARYWDFAPLSRPFNFRHGALRGIEASVTYAEGPFSAWSSFALARATGRRIVSSQSDFTPAQLLYAGQNDVSLDTDERLTGSGGASWRSGPLLVAADFQYGSGAPRTPLAGPVNGSRLDDHLTVSLAAVYRLTLLGDKPLHLRLDINNLFDSRFAIRDGTGLAGGTPQWGERRGVFVGFEQGF